MEAIVPRLRVWGLVVFGMLLLGWAVPVQAGVVRVAIVPLEVHAPNDISYLANGIQDMLASRLASSEIELVEPAEVEVALTGVARPLTPKTAAQVAESLRADFVLYGSLTKLGDRYSLNWHLLKASEPKTPIGLARQSTEDELIPAVDELSLLAIEVISGKPPTTLVAKAAPVPAPAPVAAPPSAPAPPPVAKPKKKALFALSDEAKPDAASQATFQAETVAKELFSVVTAQPTPVIMAVGDLDNDGAGEVIFANQKDLAVYKLIDGVPNPAGRFPSPLPGKLIMVSAGDIDGDGRAEIALTSLYGELPRAGIFRWSEGGLERVAKISLHHLRIIPSPQGPVLAGQEANLSELFFGGFIQFGLQGGRLVRRGSIAGSNNITFSTLVLADLDGDGRGESIGLGETEKLTVVNSAGRLMYRSQKVYGGTNNAFPISVSAVEGSSSDETYFRLNAPLLVDDIDQDGKPEILAVHNRDSAFRLIQRLSFYREGTINVFTWDGTALAPKWSTPQIEDYISGAGIARIEGNGSVLVMSAIKPDEGNALFGELFFKSKGFIYSAPLTVDQD